MKYLGTCTCEGTRDVVSSMGVVRVQGMCP